MPPRKRAETIEPAIELANLPPARGAATTAEWPAPEKTPTELRREDELEGLLASVGSDTQLVVYHVIDGKTAYAGAMTGEGFSLESLLDTFGGGEKSIVIMQGGRRMDKVRVALDPAIPPTSPRQRAQERRDGTATGNKPGGSPSLGEMGTFIAAIGQSQATMMQMMATIMASSHQQNQGMMNAMVAMLGQKPTTDPMDMLVKAAELFRQRDGASGSMLEAFSLFDKGLTLGQKINAGGEDETLSVIKAGIETAGTVLASVVQSRAQQGAENGSAGSGNLPGDARPVARISAPAINEPRHAGGNPGHVARDDVAAHVADESITGASTPASADGRLSPVSDDARAWVKAVAPHRAELAWAAGFLSPQTAAFEIVLRLDEDQFNDLMDDIEDETPPGFAGRVRAIFPGLSVTDVWLTAMIDAVVAQAQIESGETDAPPGDAPNP